LPFRQACDEADREQNRGLVLEQRNRRDSTGLVAQQLRAAGRLGGSVDMELTDTARSRRSARGRLAYAATWIKPL
jgi:hypothetical protein